MNNPIQMQRRNSAFFFNTKFVSQEYFYIFEFKHQIFRHWNRTVLECFQKKKKRNTEKRYLSKPNFKNLLNLSTRINRYIYFSSISIILAVLLEALRDISLFPSLRKPTHSHVLHRNKTFNSRIHAFIYGIRCIRTCKIYIYISLKRRRAISFSVCFRVRNFAILIIARGASCAV